MRSTRGVGVAAVLLVCVGLAGAGDDRVYEKVILGGTPQGTPPDDPSLHVDPNTPTSPYAGSGPGGRCELTGRKANSFAKGGDSFLDARVEVEHPVEV